jgi:hypothetical protein
MLGCRKYADRADAIRQYDAIADLVKERGTEPDARRSGSHPV